MQKKRRLIAVLALSVASLILFKSDFAMAKKIKYPEVFSIGTTLPLSGLGAAWGEMYQQGMRLAQDEINGKGGINGIKIKIIWDDHGGKADLAVTKFNKLVNIQKVPIVISAQSIAVLSQVPIADRTKTLLINVGASSPLMSNAGEFTISTMGTQLLDNDAIAHYAYEKLGIRKIGIIAQRDDWGVGMLNRMKEVWSKLGGTIVGIEEHSINMIEHKSALSKLKNTDMDALYILSSGAESGRVVKEARELGITQQLLGHSAINVKEFWQVAGSYSEGLYAGYLGGDINSPIHSVRKFLNAFKNKYGKPPYFVLEGTSYDGVMLVAKSMKKLMDKNKMFTGRNFLDAIWEIREWDSAIWGHTFLREDHTVFMTATVKVIENGKFKVVEQYDAKQCMAWEKK